MGGDMIRESLINCLPDGATLLFIGDSITDCDRTGVASGSLGFGYVGLLNDLLIARHPSKRFSVVNKGINGNTISHLLSRWCDDVVEYQPQVLFILIGINDVTRYLDHTSSAHLPPLEFGECLNRIVLETRKRLPVCRIILMEPFFISKGDDMEGSYRCNLMTLLSEYQAEVRDTAAKHGAILVPLSSVFSDMMTHRPSFTFSEDRIHPNRTGHMVIAETLYKILTFDKENC